MSRLDRVSGRVLRGKMPIPPRKVKIFPRTRVFTDTVINAAMARELEEIPSELEEEEA